MNGESLVLKKRIDKKSVFASSYTEAKAAPARSVSLFTLRRRRKTTKREISS